MSNGQNREVYVLADFTGLDGKDHKRKDILTVAYETPQQRREVNTLVYRGFLTLDVAAAKEHAESEEDQEPEESKKTTAKKTGRKSGS